MKGQERIGKIAFKMKQSKIKWEKFRINIRQVYY